ncbi:transmembrane protein, putative [Medicago truncatula]|uniref:Transmembrane protein, putative n=1 Tax=Medicago truncatula TaxID=3880 RepID=A0A072ULL4_MEDTR|nr:transmembrane protein, putative [Medicago truncatula]
MGYYYCKPRANDTHTSNVVLFLAVALILLVIPKLFSSEPEEEVEVESGSSPFVLPILVLLMVLLVSWLGSSSSVSKSLVVVVVFDDERYCVVCHPSSSQASK